MKKIILFVTISLFISCSQPCDNKEITKTAGMVLSGDSIGTKFMLGSDQDAQLAADLVKAYADGNFDLMNEMTTETVMFFEPSVGSYIPVVSPANEFLSNIQSPYDSIQRFIFSAIPTKRVGNDFTTVSVAFREFRYKGNEVEKLRVLDRISIRDGKIFRVNQWNGILD